MTHRPQRPMETAAAVYAGALLTIALCAGLVVLALRIAL